MDKTIKLNTTAYSLLGLLSKKSWSAYELTEFMGLSVIKFILPRSRSQLYSEPKKLAELGLITLTKEVRQGRERSLFDITPEGRRVFDEWLQQPGENLKVEYKSLLKFYLQHSSDTPALRKRISEMRAQTLADIHEALSHISHILDEGIIFQQTAAAASMTTQFGVNQFKARLAWLDSVDHWLQQMPNQDEIENWALARYQESHQQLMQLVEQYDEQPNSRGDL